MEQFFTGWVGFREEEAAFDSVIKCQDPDRPVFAPIDEFSAAVALPESTFDLLNWGYDAGFAFWETTPAFFGPGGLTPGNQDRGNCVGYSAALSSADGMCEEVLIRDDIEQPFAPLVHFQYGAGRVYIGKNRLGRGDGSLGAWQIAADHEIGLLPANTPGLPGYKASEPCEPGDAVYREWGYTKSILDKWRPIAARHRIGVSARISATDELLEAVVDLRRPCTIASNQGFRSAGFDQRYGIQIWKPGGNWAHQMSIRGIVKIKGAWFVYIGNQWGRNYHGDPGGGAPRGGFWTPLEVMDSWIPRAVVYSRGRFEALPPKLPDFGVL